MVFAFLFHFEAKYSIRLFFTDTSAISVRAKKPFNNVNTKIITNSIKKPFKKIIVLLYDIPQKSNIEVTFIKTLAYY